MSDSGPGTFAADTAWIERSPAETLRRIDPEVELVFGGNTASYFWRDLVDNEEVDAVALGDGEAPLLALCRGDPSPPNVVRARGEWERNYTCGHERKMLQRRYHGLALRAPPGQLPERLDDIPQQGLVARRESVRRAGHRHGLPPTD